MQQTALAYVQDGNTPKICQNIVITLQYTKQSKDDPINTILMVGGPCWAGGAAALHGKGILIALRERIHYFQYCRSV